MTEKPEIRTLVAYVPICKNCLSRLADETTLRGWKSGEPADVFRGDATFVACPEHQPGLDAILAMMPL